MMQVAGLHIYPLKAARAIDLDQSAVEPMGLAGDRQWMLVGADGVALTQRCTPQLTQLNVALAADGSIAVSVDDAFDVHCAVPDSTADTLSVRVWSSTVADARVVPNGSQVISEWLGTPATLVRFPGRGARLANPRWAGADAPVGFADAYPVLIALTGSLDALNGQLASPVTMNRFRPNIVIEGGAPWADDSWQRIRIGELEMTLVKPCVRCLVTTLDPHTGAKLGKEPLATLGKIRRSAVPDINGVLFGTNAVPQRSGTVRMGDAVEVLETRTPWAVAQ